MGKYSQYRRRGSPGQPTTTPDRRPPAPHLTISGLYVQQNATGLDDLEGTIGLYSSIDEGVTWGEFDSTDWESWHLWGLVTDYVGLWLRSTETGNGIDYVGESLPSNELHL